MAVRNVNVSKSSAKVSVDPKARTAKLSVSYKGTKLDSEISAQASSFSYTDNASGESDAISINLMNASKNWMNKWLPTKGDKITPSITLNNWFKENSVATMKCGSFIIDDLSFSGRPLVFALGGVSKPANEDFSTTERTETYEDATIKEIASKIAKRAGLTLYYEADTIRIDEIEQSETPDSTFLSSLCDDYGLAMKVYNNKLVIFDEARYEAKDTVATIDETDMKDWNCNSTIEGTYTGAKVSYTIPDTEKTVTKTVGKAGRMYETSLQVSSEYDAELKAAAIVNKANKNITTMTFKIMANPKIIATSTVEITGLGKLNGKYYVDQVKHNLGSGYTMTLTLHMIQPRIGSTDVTSRSSSGGNYIVKRGDNLWMLAKKFYGSGTKYTVIYEANKEVIEATAKAHGFSSSQNGHWIFPGTELVIP